MPSASAGRIRAALQQTYVVVVTYNPDVGVLHRQFVRLAAEGISVVVVDNCSRNHNDVSAMVLKHAFGLISLAQNEGVAAAHNHGIEYIRSKGGKFLIFLDQDSTPEAGAFATLVNAYFSHCATAKVGAIGSSYTLPAGNQGSSFVRFGWFHFNKIYCQHDSLATHEVDFLISSGTLIPLAVIDEVGLMRKNLFIDHVDTDWFLRARSYEYQFYGCCASRMSHALGERTVRVWLGRWRTVPVHKGFRYFFTFRNSLWLYKQSYAPTKWISADIMRLIYIFIFSGVLAAERKENIKWMWKGIRAGLRSEDLPSKDWGLEATL